MEHKTFQFKSNINCSGCIAAVTPQLEKAVGIASWEVDIANPDKILTIVSDGISEDKVVELIQKAGFKVEPLP